MVSKYIPKQGDLVYLDFNPIKGHEQRGFRPAIVISNNIFNINTKMVMVCPISSNIKEFPTHYHLEDSIHIKGSVFCEHIRSIDYEIRNLKYIEKASENDLLSVMMLVNACIEE